MASRHEHGSQETLELRRIRRCHTRDSLTIKGQIA